MAYAFRGVAPSRPGLQKLFPTTSPRRTYQLRPTIAPLRFPRLRPLVGRVVVRGQSTEDDVVSTEVRDSVRVVFSVAATLDFGLTLKLCGSCEALGNWDLESAPAMTWTEGQVWKLRTELPCEAIEVKASVVGSGGASGRQCVAVAEDAKFVRWEPGENRVVQVPRDVNRESVVHFSLKYCETETVEALVQPDPAPEPPTEVQGQSLEKQAPPGEATTSKAAADGEEVTEAEAETQKNSAAEELLSREIPESPTTDLAEPVKEGTPTPDPVDDVLSVAAREENSEAEPPSRISNAPESLADNTNEQSEGTSEETADREAQSEPAPQSSREEKEAYVNVVLTGLGVACLPVILLSELTLNQTGCGLPPGPVGLFGAAEGVSYLVVPGVVLWGMVQRLRSRDSGVPFALEFGSLVAVLVGIAVLASQVTTYGYVPSALPDEKCPAQPTSLGEIGVPAEASPNVGTVKRLEELKRDVRSVS